MLEPARRGQPPGSHSGGHRLDEPSADVTRATGAARSPRVHRNHARRDGSAALRYLGPEPACSGRPVQPELLPVRAWDGSQSAAHAARVHDH
jgi:hypothetical protein